MKYQKAKELLPSALLAELQQYMEAGYLYIPAKAEHHKQWGEASGYRQELKKRNQQILANYRSGYSVKMLAEENYLSIAAIRKIIAQSKAKN